MQTIKNKINLKYKLLEWDDKKLQNYLKDEKSYDEFMQTLSNILITESNYDFYIYERSDFIKDEINSHNKDNEIPIYEKFINKRLKLLDTYWKSDLADFKSQYACFYTANMKLPYNLRDERTYDIIIRKNYENIKKIENIIIYDDNLLKESLKGDIFLLATINSILHENKFVEDDLISLFEEIASMAVEKESFENNLKYICYKMYQSKTLKSVKQFKSQKQKNKKLIK